ncbi:MAG: hypothetical protein ACLGIN_08385 [Candidatus Sericytochromatia bacterium]
MSSDRELVLPGVLGVVLVMAGLIGVRGLADAQQGEKARPLDMKPEAVRPAVPQQ